MRNSFDKAGWLKKNYDQPPMLFAAVLKQMNEENIV